MWINLMTEEELKQIPPENQRMFRVLLRKYNLSMAFTWGSICIIGLVFILQEIGIKSAMLVLSSFPFGIGIGLLVRKYLKRGNKR